MPQYRVTTGPADEWNAVTADSVAVTESGVLCFYLLKVGRTPLTVPELIQAYRNWNFFVRVDKNI